MSVPLWRSATPSPWRGLRRLPVLRYLFRMPAPPGRRPVGRSTSSVARGRRSGHRGQALVEFAIILPVFMLLFLTAIDFGRLFFSYIEVSNAAREAAAYGAGDPTNLPAMTARARQETNAQAQGGENPITVTAACADAGGAALSCASAAGGSGTGNTITTNVDEKFTFFTPLIGGLFNGNDLHVGAAATAVVLGVAPSTGTPPGTCGPPSLATFTVATNGLTVTVDGSASQPNTGLCAISGYNWDFGDAGKGVGTGTGTSYTYLAPGTFTITLTVTNQGGPLSTTRSVTVTNPTCSLPTASFTWSQQNRTKPVVFDASASTPTSGSCAISSYSWDFGDGSADGTGVKPSHSYPSSGATYNVTLTVTNPGGQKQLIQTVTTK